MTHSIIWTRAAEEWENDRDIFGQDLAQVVRLPCLRLQVLDAKWPSQGAEDSSPERYVVCFTSQKAVEAVPKDVRPWLAQVKKVMTFGEQTQQALVRQGLPAVRLPASGGFEFSRILPTQLDPSDRVLICAAKYPAYPIAEDIRRAGFEVTQLALYSAESGVFSETGQDLDGKKLKELAEGLRGSICFASPSAVRGFVERLGERNPDLYKRLACGFYWRDKSGASAKVFCSCQDFP